ncbi:MAG: GGDEF domain-containing protein [Gammaproteobacteria bacterium]|nr:MAG: GGDEF domain-containing protein [Gammaproteobacteria bacterium]
MLTTRLVYPLIVPLMIISVAIWLREYLSLLPDSYLVLLSYLPYALLIATGILSLQFNQLRGLLIAITLALSFLIIQLLLQNSLEEAPALTSYFLLSLLLPFMLMMISWFPERGILTSYGLLFLVVTSLPVFVAIYLYFNPNLIISPLSFFIIREWSFSVLSPFAILIYLVAIVHQLMRLWILQQPFDAAISVVLVALLLNFSLFDQTYISVVVFSAIQLILIWSVLKQSHDMAYRDELTGLPGRRALNEALKSPGRKYVLAMMDIDFFKKFNDRYGHDVGDDVLKVVASKMAEVTGGGRAYRYGGEEFTVLFKGKELETCIPHLEAVREDIASYSLSIREKSSRPKTLKEGKTKRGSRKKSKGISVTISIGVAKKRPELSSAELVLKAADKALYKAKKAGRNCLIADKK